MSPDSVTHIPLLGFGDELWDSPEFMSLILDQPVNRTTGEPGKCSRTDAVGDQKRRRMMSNRESARRSRMRKQQHLDGLGAQVTRLQFENRELENRIGLARRHLDAVLQENEQLRQEAAALCWMLRQSYRILQLQLMAALNTQNHSVPAIIT